MKRFVVLAVFLALARFTVGQVPDIEKNFEEASVEAGGSTIVVSTGKVERVWKWTGKGLVTVSVKGFGDKEYIDESPNLGADWDLGQIGKAELVSLKAFDGDDDGFTSSHLAVEAQVAYEKLMVKYVIWAYPEAQGIRTQLWIKGKAKDLGAGISERLSMAKSPKQVRVFGYRAGLKSNMKPYEILREKKLGDNNSVDWASGLITEADDGAMVLVKESHLHTALKNGVATGKFLLADNIITVTGLGLKAGDLKTDDYRFCWANWMICYKGGNEDAQLAIKRFDRRRYPVRQQEIFIMANTWGTEDRKWECKYKAREENVFKEINSCADLGIDILQIDDGWQNDNWRPIAKTKAKNLVLHGGKKVTGFYEVYPEGFAKVRAKAKEVGVNLGLWHANWAPLEALKANYSEGDFKAFKLDFANLKTKDKLDELYYKARHLINYSDHSAVVNWDVTEAPPRMGYYFGRDCGNLYLANRKAKTVRKRVQYDPWQILRDGWELAKYMNLNKVQLTFQNKDFTPENSNSSAMEYSHGYNLVITLMSSPIFFQETQYLSDKARKEIKPIIDVYKAHRKKMYSGYVFPIGDKPDNGSWTGFQNVVSRDSGYLTVFRELNNKQSKNNLTLRFLNPSAKLKIRNVLTGSTKTISLNDKRQIEFEISDSPGFLFLEYKVVK